MGKKPLMNIYMKSKESPLVSVIMPAYNAENTIENSILSVLAQSYDNIELIIVNDGSKDKTADVCQGFDDDRIVYIYQDNQGPSGARNTGLKLCRGSFVCFVDSDDEIDKEYVRELYNTIIYRNSQLAICGVRDVWGDSYSCNTFEDYHTFDTPLQNERFLRLLESGLLNSACNKLYVTEIILNNNIRFESIVLVEDILFNIIYYSKIKTASVSPLSLYYYKHENSVLTRNVSPHMYDSYYRVHSLLLSLVPNSMNQLIHVAMYHQYFSIFNKYMLSIVDTSKINVEILSFLHGQMRNTLVVRSFDSYKPKGFKETLVHYVVKYGFYRIYYLYMLKSMTFRK